jgi:DNA replication protein DnaC
MTEELEQLLKNLQLRRMLEIYDEQLRAADKDDISYTDFVTRLVRAQWQAKQEGALEWRIRRANLPERWSLETFPFDAAVAQAPGAAGRAFNRRIWIFESETGAIQHLFQTDRGALPAASLHYYNQSRV